MHTTEALCADPGVVDSILARLADRVGPKNFNAWFKHGTRLDIEGGHIKVMVANQFVANWVETHFRSEIAETAAEMLEERLDVLVAIDPGLSGTLGKRQRDMQSQIVATVTSGRSRGPGVPVQPLRYKLEEFVVGQSNRLAYSAAMAVASGDGHGMSPLFIHGTCGVGKTHLLQGICEAANRQKKDGKPLRVRYVTGEQFTNDYISAVRRRQYTEFRAKYRNLDVLAVDDVHFLSAKKATQEEFLHTFNAIETARKHVIMCSDAHPRMLGDLLEQLTSRFVSGMVVKIDPPDRQTRLEILNRRAQKLGIQVEPEALDYVAATLKGSVRDLEGALVKLSAMARLDGRAISLAMSREVLADQLARTGSALTVGDIEAVVSAFFGVCPADLHSSRRTRTVSAARMTAMFLARRHTTMSFPEIGRYMGKNHSSVVLAVQKMERLLAKDAELTWMTPIGSKHIPAGTVVELLTEQFK